MADVDVFELRYTSTVRDKIEALSWFQTVISSIKPQEPLRTRSPFYATPFFISFLIGCAVPILFGLLFKALMPSAAPAFFVSFWVGLVVGGGLALLGLAVQKFSPQSQTRAFEKLLMQANGGLHDKDCVQLAAVSNAGLGFESDDGGRSYPWSRLLAFLEQQDRFVFGFRNGDVASIPKAAMSGFQIQALRTHLTSHTAGTANAVSGVRA